MSDTAIKTAVVFHSGFGHTQRMAEAVAQGARAGLVPIDAEGNLSDEQWEKLNGADAIIFGSPTYMGGPSWQFKKFADLPRAHGSRQSGRTRSLAASPTAPA